ncbi:MAG: TIGR04283 family arsenosugar biosynthesis glycosyltransferase [Peptoniphilus sp.]|uniref:TIGR04283 family arsenosugar biosynthesis glycosyltransferase n=1 Tax=Peptoniphilus sp. TaxID=1971214 RepID=UPI002A750E13|nr:TIGR04283 family arsenosugar biosynthesis glycosyltransferase [Peptoniphilus sp.]MDY2986178.1 TIGR04283 family arsenosugar biosynthesis glycosyltransferase [Peptoniphilus sp.]
MISIIIPTYNESLKIEEFQKQLETLKGDFEVIFSDGFSTDNTYEKIYFPKIQESKYRSNQMNSAVKYSKGDYLWFLHADSKIHADSILAIENSNSDVGCFTLAFDSPKWQMSMIAFNSSLRVKFRNIAFGDQGIFIRRDLFKKIGGYAPIPLMEDYQLSIDLKKLGKKFYLSPLPITTSARRFEDNGIWKTVLKMQLLQYKYRKSHDIDEIYRRY